MSTRQHKSDLDFHQLALNIKQWGQELGFQQTGISNTGLEDAEVHLGNWLKAGFHGEMD